MKIAFSINYNTSMGYSLFLSGAGNELGEWNTLKAVKMTYAGTSLWTAELNLPTPLMKIEYKYVVCKEDGTNPQWESGNNRVIEIDSDMYDFVFLSDIWNNKNNELKAIESSTFKDVIFKRKITTNKLHIPERKLKKSKIVTFEVFTPKILPEHDVFLVGNSTELGDWETKNALQMTEVSPYLWKVVVEIKGLSNITYKYAIRISDTDFRLETGNNRTLELKSLKEEKIFKKDQMFQYSDLFWRGVGVVIPVFSLRSKQGFGVGEFTDIKILVDWCNISGVKMIQLLPINDTIHNHTKLDTYPYDNISVFALHPLYLNIDALGSIPLGMTSEILKERRNMLNSKKDLDYEAVMSIKSRIYKMAYDVQKIAFLKDPDFLKFFENNEEWLVPYAAYSYLRDLYGTYNYSEWGQYSKYNRKLIKELVKPSSSHYDEIAVHYYIQYHLHKQLLESVVYARGNGVVLNGDIPIGVTRYGVDTWVNPELFHLDGQAGAPPDDFAVNGQNWGFPTYNWEEMSKDNFLWWRLRLQQLAKYFDSFRIDHILGFFRIWEMPSDSVTGLLGCFRSAIPIHKSELDSLYIDFNEERYCEPYIRSSNIYHWFKEKTEEIKNKYLNEYSPNCFRFKEQFNTQKKIEEYFDSFLVDDVRKHAERIEEKEKLYSLISDVLFIRDKEKKDYYHPRITINKTFSFNELDGSVRNKVYNLYIDYYYHRQESFWKEQALKKLPPLLSATNMLIGGEDLGMVPDCVHGVMDELGILSLKVQRMPSEASLAFDIPANYPYMSFCTPGTHDMSTIRGWWEEDRGKTQKYYNEILKEKGDAPFYCEPWIAEKILNDHLTSLSMWSVFQIQDIVAIGGGLRVENPHSERINIPSNPKHVWKYRFHIFLEDLIKEDEFNKKLKKIIFDSGRGSITY